LDKKLLIFFVLSSFIFIKTAFALDSFSISAHPNITGISTNVLFNFTINNTDSQGRNITEINFTLPSYFNFVSNSNGTTAQNWVFNYYLTQTGKILRFSNITSEGLVNNTTAQYFWFNASISMVGFFNISVKTLDTSGEVNTTNVTIEVNGIIPVDLPSSLEFGSPNVNITCVAHSNNSLSNMTLYISNLTKWNETSQQWLQPVWNNINNTTTVSGTHNSTSWVYSLYGNYSDFYKYVFRCEAMDNSGNLFTSSNISFIVSLRNLTGYVRNSTGNVEGANVTLYRVQMQQFGPPIETPVASNLTDSNGKFTFYYVNTTRTCSSPDGINVSIPSSCQPEFRIKVFYNNSNGIVTQVGPLLPSFPRELIFGFERSLPPGAPRPPSINGSTIYLQPAATLRLRATNSTGQYVRFGYEIMDEALGYPVESCVQCNVLEKNISLPIDRNYTVMFVRDPQIFTWINNCPNVMNETHCPTPPMSNSSLPTLNQGDVVDVTQNLSFSHYNLTGCINVSGGINMTNVFVKLIPWAGFIPPVNAEVSSFNVSDPNDLNYSDPQCGSGFARYNLELMGSPSGIEYMIEFYGNSSTEYYAAFQNVTMHNQSINLNITLRPLAGAFVQGTTLSTKKVTVRLFKNLVNKSECTVADGTMCQYLQNPHVEVEVKSPYIYNNSPVHYIIEEISNGSFSMPFLSGSTAKVNIFSQDTAPQRRTLNLSNPINNITLYPFRPEKINPNGQLEEFNQTEKALFTMRFYRSGGSCDVQNPPESCALEGGNFSMAEFDPMKAMLAGKVNLRIITPNITLYFINVDMLASGPPEPQHSERAFSESRGASSLEVAWRLGSLAPKVYDYVYIGITDPSINSTWTYNMSITKLFDENWNVIWDSSINSLTNVPEDYTDYNATNSPYRSFLTTNGKQCNFTNSSEVCYINTTENKFWIKIPHFSGIQPTLKGTAPTVTVTILTTAGTTQGFVSLKIKRTKGNVNITIPSIGAGVTKNITITKTEDVAIRKISISVKNAVNNVEINIFKLPGKPAEVTQEVEGKVYHYIKIDKANITDADLEKVIIRFGVNKTWLNESNIDPSNITLYRWEVDKWNALTTNQVDETWDEYLYEAISPGLSYFAIGTKAVQAAPPENVTAPACVENWQCTEWSECINGTQTRTCTDLNACGTTLNKPEEQRSCVVEKKVPPSPGFPTTIVIVIVIVAIVIFGIIFYFKREKIEYVFSRAALKKKK